MISLLNRFNNLPLARRLSLIMLTISILTLSAAILVVLRASNEALRVTAGDTLIAESGMMADEIDKHLSRVETLLGLIVKETRYNAAQGAPDSTAVTIAVESIMERETSLIFRRLIYYRPDQTLGLYEFPNVTSGRDMLVRSISANSIPPDAWYLGAFSASDSQHGWVGPHTSVITVPVDTAISFVAYYPGATADSAPGGMLWAEVSIRSLQELMRTTANLERFPARGDDGSNTYLVSPSGEIIANLYPSNNPEAFLQNALNLATTSELLPLNERLPSGETGYAIHTALPTSGGKLMSIIADSNLPSLRSSTLQTVMLLGSLGLLAMVLTINTFVYRTVGRPIEQLGSTAQKIGAGDMRQVVEYQHNRDEIGLMARALEEMRRDLQTSYDLLEQRVEERTTELNVARQIALTSASELRAVYDESLSVVTDHRLDILLDSFAQRILRLLDADYCGVWLLRSNGYEIKLVAHTTEDASLTGTTVPLGQGLVGLVTQTARPIMVDDYGTWPNRLPLSNIEKVHRALCVPLISSRKPIGAVMVGRSRAGVSFDDDDQRLLILFANMVSPSVRNAQLIAQLEDARKTAEGANMVKTRFLASITHELRTPLNLIINNMDFMRIGVFGDVTEEQVERLEQTVRSAEHLLYLINDLLDVSKIEAGEMKLFIQPTEVHPILEDALDSALVLLDKDNKGAKIAINAHIPDHLPEIPADGRRVRQVLFNLLSNAVKFTEAGEITLHVIVLDDFIRFVVTDTGMGIAETAQQNLFQAFERAERANQLGIEGTGLGLAISRYLVEAHGGEISVTSEEGVGSTFSFTIPRSMEGHPTQATDTQIIAIPRY